MLGKVAKVKQISLLSKVLMYMYVYVAATHIYDITLNACT